MFLVRPHQQSKFGIDSFINKNKFVCKICKNTISQQHCLFSIQGNTPYHTFYNPNHHRFDIMILSHCQSLLDLSPPSLEYTWFAGYTWVILCCASCYEHLGWRFENAEKHLQQFFGMIQDKLEIAT